MGSLFRSEEMQLVQLFVQVEAAHDTVDELGKLGLVQFRDLNTEVSAFQRNFVNEVKRCEEMDRKLRFFDEQVKKEREEIIRDKQRDKEAQLLLVTLDSVEDVKVNTLNELETQFEELEKELLQMKGNQEMLNRNYAELVEMQHVLTKDGAFFAEMGDDREDRGHNEKIGLLGEKAATEGAKAVKLGFLTGVINRDKFPSFERVLWRSTRGNLFMKHADIEEKIKDPQSNELVQKNVFIIFFQGERAQMKIKKICESFGANTYQIPDAPVERKSFLGQVGTRLDDLVNILARSKKHRRQVLADIAKHLPHWQEKVIKEKAIYDTMNLFNYDVGRKCLIAEGWTPKTATEKIVTAMRKATESSGALVPSILSVVKPHEEPPTNFRTNRFTRSFQAIIDAYGIAHYREVNPGVFTIITFPFLFAVMFGDFGHGILLTMTASYFIIKEKQLAASPMNEMIKTCFDGRYLLLLMGIFSIYTGALYNECFSVAMDIFGSKWYFNETAYNITRNTSSLFEATRVGHSVYPFGVDPAWNGASNMLDYYNSLKMKLSVILGVTQMVGGIFLSLVNAIHFGHGLDIVAEFIPQVLFMLSLFGYMVFLIIYKWLAGTNSSPFILQVMIFMFLSPASLSADTRMFPGQLYVQWALILIAVISVPWMLLSKPLTLRSRNKSREKFKAVVHDQHDDHGHGEDGEGFDFGEIFVKQIIHTIEFVLGAVSNTASYLRLWALSLAHSELSQVFWEKVFVLTLSMASDKGWIIGMFIVFVGFSIWAGMTLAVLMIMESLSAFLHALRLHWVEFQNKFYHGDGHKFMPFSYEILMSGEDDS